MRPKVITTVTLDSDANGISVDQTTSGAADLTITGVLASGGVATIAEAQKVLIEGVGDNDEVNFTITGTDADGHVMSETLVGADSGTVTTAAAFKTVTTIAVDSAVDGNVEIGVLNTNGLIGPSVPVNWRQSPFNISLSAEELKDGGTAFIQYTVDDPTATYTNGFSTDANWVSGPAAVANITDSGDDAIDYPIRAVRGILTVGDADSTWKFTFIQGQNG